MVENAHTPDPVDIHVGARLRLRRIQVGMNQEGLAKAIKVTFQQVQKYERGANRLSASRLHAASRALRVAPGYFFEELPGGEGDELSAAERQGCSMPVMTVQGLELVTLLPAIEPDVRRAILVLARILAKREAAGVSQDDHTP